MAGAFARMGNRCVTREALACPIVLQDIYALPDCGTSPATGAREALC